MKLLTTSSADIIQECRVIFGVKSVPKSIFKRRRNVLPVVAFKMSNIRRIKLNNNHCNTTDSTTDSTTCVNARKTLVG